MHDTLAASRVLATGVAYRPGGEDLLDEIRRLGAKLDAGSWEQRGSIGALAQLRILQGVIGSELDLSRRVEYLIERAQLREQRLRDPHGAMIEWLRVLQIDAENGQAERELRRLASDHEKWALFLVPFAWDLADATSVARKRELLIKVADLYEGALQRREYALRARIAAWGLEPVLPPMNGDLGDEHAEIWRLAGVAPSYDTPPIPSDPTLRPTWTLPEQMDATAWAAGG